MALRPGGNWLVGAAFGVACAASMYLGALLGRMGYF